MKRNNSIMGTLQSGLMMTLIVLWGAGVVLTYMFRVFHRGAVKIVALGRQGKRNRSDCQIELVEPMVFLSGNDV
jgi:hypothetical protein